MKNKLSILLCAFVLCVTCVGCEKKDEQKTEPQLSQMKAICQLATLECYYHNVDKYHEDDASGFWIFTKDKDFWVEYGGVVTLGIDASNLNMKVNGDVVEVTVPEAVVLDCKVNEDEFTEDSFYVAKGSAKVKAEDQQKVLEEAQKYMKKTAEEDEALMESARQRAQSLIEDYVKNIGSVTGVDYKIKWDQKDGGTKE